MVQQDLIIDRNISDYSVNCDSSLREALSKIDENEDRIIFTVSESGELLGVLTDGDLRRWLLGQKTVDLELPVQKVANSALRKAFADEPLERIRSLMAGGIEFIPLVSRQGRLLSIARYRQARVRIGSREISDVSPAFLIAEIGNNHNGSLDLAIRLIDEAAQAGVDCAKFQLRNLSTLYRNQGNSNDASEELGSQYTLDLLSRYQLTSEQMFKAFDHCKTRGLIPLCTPWDMASFEVLERYGMGAYKVASADLTNHQLLEAVARTGKPMICSTGMSTDSEIEVAIRLLKREGAQYVLLQCNSTYPAPFKDINLEYMLRLKELGGCLVGYSGHERGFHVPLAAIAMGARVIEKHFTLDRDMEGNDHRVSLLPAEMAQMVQYIRDIESSMGARSTRYLSQGELMNREVLGKSLMVSQAIKKGQIITRDKIEIRSPGTGLPPYRINEIVGMHAGRDIEAGDFLFPTDLGKAEVSRREFKFGRVWGVPARYHDFKKITAGSNVQLVEFHLSYKDLEEKLEVFFQERLPIELAIHSPELFARDHVLDLSSLDESYRETSIRELQRVVDITLRLKKFFPNTERPKIVVNAGGFTSDDWLPPREKDARYKFVAESCRRISGLDEVQLLIQTMPPFPWHFGGQRIHNLFVDPDEIVGFCEMYGFRVCLDVSHSKLAANHFGWSFHEFVRKIGKYVEHIHLADASGIDGEGLQIGEGEIDFAALAEDLRRHSPQASFIPEIWQGHKNEGVGFWTALDRLESWF